MTETIILLYGSTGDLTFRKILPALSYLKVNNLLPNTKVIALGRRDFDNEKYYDFVIERNHELDINSLRDFVSYYKMEITNLEDYKNLKNHLDSLSNENTKVLHYLAIASPLMKTSIDFLYASGIASKKLDKQLLIFEKPFGNNYIEADMINTYLENNFSEEQIYRVDHYLGKPMAKYLLDYKYNYYVLNQILNKTTIDKISIVLKEEESILDRGPYYDKTGAITDMFQSHILQMIALIAMSKPKTLINSEIIKEKIKVLKKLRVNYDSLVFGQYLGYLKEDRVLENSLTETLFACQLIIKNENKNIPINILTGKKLNEKRSYIKYHLKDGSEVVINLYPESNVLLTNQELKGKLDILNEQNAPDYSNIILAILNNIKALFVSKEEVMIMHKITDEIKALKGKLLIYQENLNIEEIFKNF